MRQEQKQRISLSLSLSNKTFNVHLTQAFQHIQCIVQSLLSVSHAHKHTKTLYKSVSNTLHPWCEKPWGLSKVDGLLSGCSRENARRLNWRFYIIFLQPTHTSHSPTSDKNLLDRMWLTSFGRRRLNSSSVTLLRWPLSSFHCLYFFHLQAGAMCVVITEEHTVLQEFTYCQNEVLIILTWTPSDSCGGVFDINLRHMYWIISSINSNFSEHLREAWKKTFLKANLKCCCLCALENRRLGQVEKGTHTVKAQGAL